MMKITTITVLVISLLLLYGDGAVSRNHSNPSSVDKDDARLVTDNEPPKVDSDWKEIIIKAVESNVKSNSASKKKAAGKLLKDVQNAFKSGIKYPIFRVGNRNVRGYLGDEKSKERKENECWFQRKLREWGTIFMNFFRKIFHRPVKTDSTVATESELEALKKSQNGGVGSPVTTGCGIKSDSVTIVLLPADVFEKFRIIRHRVYSLDPVHHYTTPRISGYAQDDQKVCSRITR